MSFNEIVFEGLDYSPEGLNRLSQSTLMESLGISYVLVEDGLVEGRMPVDSRTRQPFGFLHGGATAAFAETLASVGSMYLLRASQAIAFGVELNVTHIRKVEAGQVKGVARIIVENRKTHLWEVRVTDDAQNLVAIARVSLYCSKSRRDGNGSE
jgi:1,4-dihydroxy-2-naphthoyl-CoA hydrolase